MMRLFLCACAAAVLATATPALAQDAPDLILHDARIITMDLDRPRAEAAAITDGAITAVGPDAEILALAGSETDVLDLDGATALPGLIDNHTHAIRGAGGDPNSFRDLAATLNAGGVTTIVDAGGFNFDPDMRSAATRLDEAGDLTVRLLFLEWLPGTTPDAARRNAERLPSLDTSPDGFTQIIGVGETLYRPLHDRPERPVRISGAARDVARLLVGTLVEEELTLHLHAFRDDTINAYVDLFEEVAPGAASQLGWTFHHANGLTPPTMKRLAEADIGVAVHPRGAAIAPSLAALEAAGVSWGLGTDAGRPGGMLPVVAWASAPSNPAAVSRSAALRAATSGNATLLGRPDLGRIAPGQRADIAVLNDDPLDPATDLATINALLTIVDGRIVHDTR